MSQARLELSCAELVDIAALGILAGDGKTETDLVDQVRNALCPHLSPTGEVIYGRLVRSLAHDHISVSDGQLALTAKGRQHWQSLMLTPMSDVRHDLAFLCEALKIAFMQGLDMQERESACNDLLQTRARCLAEQKRLLDTCQRTCPQVARCRLHQFSMAENALGGLGKQLQESAE